MGKIEDYRVHTHSKEWKPLIESGIDTSGIEIMPLRNTPEGRPPSFLLRFQPGARYPYHNHPGGEELLVLEGSCFINDLQVHQGDYLYTPPNAKHKVRSDTGCTIFFMVPQEVEIIAEDET